MKRFVHRREVCVAVMLALRGPLDAVVQVAQIYDCSPDREGIHSIHNNFVYFWLYKYYGGRPKVTILTKTSFCACAMEKLYTPLLLCSSAPCSFMVLCTKATFVIGIINFALLAQQLS